nr:hypothetical protein [Fluviispira vulneris]
MNSDIKKRIKPDRNERKNKNVQTDEYSSPIFTKTEPLAHIITNNIGANVKT